MSDTRWKILHQTRHYGDAYAIVGLGFDDFESARFSRQGDLAYMEDDYCASRDGRFRVSAFVDEWGHSCRLIEYAADAVGLLELAEIHEREARELRVAAAADALYDARNPRADGGLRVVDLGWSECQDAERLIS